MKTTLRTDVRALLLSLAVVGAQTLVPQVAFAQDLAAAEALFTEGRALLEKGEYETACAKLAESQRLDPSSGTLLNLATCHEKQGKTASAWAEFLAAARLASTQGKADRAEEAKARAAAIAPTLSYLTIIVTERAPGLEIRRDDVKLEASTLGSKLPTDPGEHVLTVSAPGYVTVTSKVTVGASHDSETVTIPALQKEAAGGAAAPGPTSTPGATANATVAPSDASAPPSSGSGRSTLGFVIGGAGVAFAAVGAVFGVMALSTEKDAKSLCPSHHGCSGDAVDRSDKANLQANIANVGVGVGIVGIGVGAWLLLTSGSSESKPADRGVAFVPEVGPSRAGVVMRGGF